MKPSLLIGGGAISLAMLFAGVAALPTRGAEATPTLNDFYRPFVTADITPENMQWWPYYRYVSMNWDDFAMFGTAPVLGSSHPEKLVAVKKPFDIEQKFRDGTFAESLTRTQTKGFLILKDNEILAEFYDNAFTREQTQLLQSSSKTYAAIIISKLIDEGKLDPQALVESLLTDFHGTALGQATLQQVLDMTSGLEPANDFHTPGTVGYLFEIEQGLRDGSPIGHRKAVRTAEAKNPPGKVFSYNDRNTDVLAMIAENVSGLPFHQLLTNLYADFGATGPGSIALTSDGTASPSYGLSSTLRDYGLFHQWLAQGKAPKSFYASLKDTQKERFAESETGMQFKEILKTPVTYASQCLYMPEREIIITSGSYGQYGFSDLKSGISVVFMQDWEDNSVGRKLLETIFRALTIIDSHGQQNPVSGAGNLNPGG